MMTTTAEQMRSYRGPAILSFGFRPFFLAGAIWAIVAIGLWLPMLAGVLDLPTAFTPLQWHAHELIYGYVPAIVSGFILTAVPNWTGRLPVAGRRLLLLFLVWLAGRIAVLTSAIIGPLAAACIDIAYLAVLAAIVARELIAGNNTRNLKVLVLIGLLAVGNTVFHVEAAFDTDGGFGSRIGVAITVLLLTIIGGRIIPSFTRNWLARRNSAWLPAPFSRFDVVAIVSGAGALAFWVAAPEDQLTAGACAVAGAIHVYRLCRWAGIRTLVEPLVAILHIGYAFVPLGFFLVALSIWQPATLPFSGAFHAWTIGAIGMMTLAVMTRASLGHTGQALTAGPAERLIYVSVGVAAGARLIAAFDLSPMLMLQFSAAAWVMAFAIFIIKFGPLLLRSNDGGDV